MTEALSSYDCPRCASTVEEPFYGPCTACRAELRNTYAAAGNPGAAAGNPGAAAGNPGSGDAASGRFEPRTTVVPNHVATKD